jgi:hypothetical protein
MQSESPQHRVHHRFPRLPLTPPRSALGLQCYSLADLSTHLREALPQGYEYSTGEWTHLPGSRSCGASHPPKYTTADTRFISGARSQGVSGLGALAWSNGTAPDSPSPWWLQRLWVLVALMRGLATEWKVGWSCVPCTSYCHSIRNFSHFVLGHG